MKLVRHPRSLRVPILAALLFLPGFVRSTETAASQEPKTPQCRTVLELGGSGGEVSIAYVPRRYDAEELARVRSDAEHRRAYSALLPSAVDAELRFTRRHRIGTLELEPGTYRLVPTVDSSGALALGIRVDQEDRDLGLLVDEEAHATSHLCLTLCPGEASGFTLLVQWGAEHGRLEFTALR